MLPKGEEKVNLLPALLHNITLLAYFASYFQYLSSMCDDFKYLKRDVGR